MIEEEIAIVLWLDGRDTAISAGLSGKRPRLRDQNVPREQAGRWEEEVSKAQKIPSASVLGLELPVCIEQQGGQ